MRRASPYGTGLPGTLRMVLCGLRSALTTAVFPLGRWWRPWARRRMTPERFDRGWVIILPGIVGHSTLNDNLARGLDAAGVDAAIEVVDWTGGWLLLFPYYLRRTEGNRESARRIAERIVGYRARHPDRPVHLIGHSGGAGVALAVLEFLPPDCRVATATLVAAAISPAYDVTRLLPRTERGIWSFYSPLDVLFLSLVTIVLGTTDGRHGASAGNLGFACCPDRPPGGTEPALRQIRYRLGMVRRFHWGGHFGYTNEVFAAEYIAPVLLGDEVPSAAL